MRCSTFFQLFYFNSNTKIDFKRCHRYDTKAKVTENYRIPTSSKAKYIIFI